MADIALRFHRDMLTIASPIAALLERQGVDVKNDLEMITLLESETLEECYRMQVAAQAPCLVAQTDALLPARLLHKRMEDKLPELAENALAAAASFRPQHLLVPLGPTGLPMDPSSKTSLLEHRDQYVRAGRVFETHTFDAYLLNGFTSVVELQCALMGLRKVSDRPIFACVDVDAAGSLAQNDTLEHAVDVMQEYEAAVAGVCTNAAPADVARLASRMAQVCDLPLMVQLKVGKRERRRLDPSPDNPYSAPETLFDAIPHLRSAGVQFIQAVGDATPAYTGALALGLKGLDVIDVRGLLED